MLKPFFLEGQQGRLFVVYHPPVTGSCRGVVVYVPAFAEEMNKSRHMVSRQAQALARLGFGCLIMDYACTGDSQGEFREASWQGWRQDVFTAIDWCHRHVSSQVSLWGLRFGCLVAASVASELESPLQRLLFWQPVLGGAQYMAQFLRLRLAGGLLTGQGKETVADLKAQLVNETYLEVAGYQLPTTLYEDICQQQLADNFPRTGQVGWFELNTKARPLAPLSRQVIESWRERDIDVQLHQAVGSQFWCNQEIVYADQLLSLSRDYMETGMTREVCTGV